MCLGVKARAQVVISFMCHAIVRISAGLNYCDCAPTGSSVNVFHPWIPRRPQFQAKVLYICAVGL